MTDRAWTRPLHNLLRVRYTANVVLQNAKAVAVELVVLEVERKDLSLDRPQTRFSVEVA